MIDPEEKRRLFDRLFNQNKDDPEEWGVTAWNLRTAADVLFEAYKKGCAYDDAPECPENEHLDSPALMLYGCAMENMIKGYLIKKHGGFEQARATKRFAWDRHQVSELAPATGIPVTPEQKLLLRSLEAFIVWAGRYPISMKRDQYTLPKQFQSGDHMTPNPINIVGVEVLQPFYKQMEDVIFADLHKRMGPLPDKP